MNKTELMKRFSSATLLFNGGQKSVFKVEEDGKTYALKLIRTPNDPRIEQEIDIIQNLNCDHVPKIFEYGNYVEELTTETHIYIIEQFIDGQSLKDYIRSNGSMSLKEGYHLISTLLKIEEILEEKKIIHRDIKPDNIMLGNDRIWLIDFGIARQLDGFSLTAASAVRGPMSPGYAPNEQATNNRMKQDVRTDLYAIGVTIYEAMTGVNPFHVGARTREEIIENTATVIPDPLDIFEDTKGMFSQFISILMAKNLSQRPDTAKDAIRYLEVIRTSLNIGD